MCRSISGISILASMQFYEDILITLLYHLAYSVGLLVDSEIVLSTRYGKVDSW
jgi:hypothetical protein